MERVEQETKRNILLQLNKDPGLWPKELERRLDVKRRAIKRHLKCFRENDILEVKRKSNPSSRKKHYIKDGKVKTRYRWEKYSKDIVVALVSVTVTVLSWFYYGDVTVIYPSLIPITAFISLILFKVMKAGDFKDVYVEM